MSHNYLAILRAIYDYETPQSEDEVAIKEDQLLFLLEKTDEDWWKIEVKPDSPDEDGPSGLVPAAYVEEAPHKKTVKALYDYAANAPGELTVKEDELLYSYDTDGVWMLAKSKDGERIGYVPANYVEDATEGGGGDAAPPSPPTSPSPPPAASQPYVEPAVRAAAAADRAGADDIQTWSLSELDKKGKKKKGTLGVGNGAVFFASAADRAPVQKWQISDVDAVRVDKDKSKHVIIEIGGSSPISLTFHAGSKDNATAITKKVEASIDIANKNHATPVSPRAVAVPPSPPPASSPPQLPPLQTNLQEAAKKNGVHFATSPPSVIERSDDADDDEIPDGAVEGLALYDFTAGGDDELSINEGDRLWVLERSSEDWWTCRNQHGLEGVVPASYVEVSSRNDVASTASAPHSVSAEEDVADVNDDEDEDEAELVRQREEKDAAERLENENREKEKRKQAELERKRQATERARAEEASKKRKQKEREAQEAARREAEEEEAEAEKEAAAKEAEKAAASRDQRRREREAKKADRKSSGADKIKGPLPKQTRTWHDKTGQFKVDAEFLGVHDGKIRLHKSNGVVIEVPQTKMSPEDMEYVRRLQKKKAKAAAAPPSPDEDDVPLGIVATRQPPKASNSSSQKPTPPRKTIDWFEFFLEAGCDVDLCTRYAAAFERDKIDESILPEIKESTMRSLGLKEGDIIRVSKAIQQRTGRAPSTSEPSDSEKKRAQMESDEALARQLQEREASGKATPDLPRRQGTASPGATNLFTEPGGALKDNTRRGRPQPSKSAPPLSVDLESISTASDSLKKASRPPSGNLIGSPSTVIPPNRTSSVTPSGFDDDAWSNRPSSTKPIAPSTPTPQIITSSPVAPTPPAAPPVVAAAQPAPAPPNDPNFDILAKISAMRTPPAPATSTSPVASPPPPSFQSGLGMGSSQLPINQHVQNQQVGAFSVPTSRGPLAPIASNQPLLNPLIPTYTGFNSFIPTRPTSNPPPPVPPLPSFAQRPFSTSPPLLSQVTGYPQQAQNFGGIVPQATGFQPQNSFLSNGYGSQPPFSGLSPPPIQPTMTGFPGSFQAPNASLSPPPSSSPFDDQHAPANVFAQMKSGTFGQDAAPQNANKYDALRQNNSFPPLAPQATGWGFQPGFPSQNGYSNYPQ